MTGSIFGLKLYLVASQINSFIINNWKIYDVINHLQNFEAD